MRLIPSGKQWRNWSLPSKLTAIGAYTGVLGVLVTLLLTFLPPRKDTLNSSSGSLFAMQDINIIYVSNYRHLYFADTISIDKKVATLALTIRIRNISPDVLRNIEAELYATPMLLNTEVLPYSYGSHELLLFGKNIAHLQPGEALELTAIETSLSESFMKLLFLNNRFGLAKLPSPSEVVVKRIGLPMVAFGEGRLRRLFTSQLSESDVSEKIANVAHVDPFLGFVGVRFRLFVKYDRGDRELHAMYFGGLYYTLTSVEELSYKIPFPYIIYDYLTAGPRGLARIRGDDRLEWIEAIDEVEYEQPQGGSNGQDLIMMGHRLTSAGGDDLSRKLLLCIWWMPRWYAESLREGVSDRDAPDR